MENREGRQLGSLIVSDSCASAADLLLLDRRCYAHAYVIADSYHDSKIWPSSKLIPFLYEESLLMDSIS